MRAVLPNVPNPPVYGPALGYEAGVKTILFYFTKLYITYHLCKDNRYKR